MATSYQEFVTTVKLNSEEAKNKLAQLRKDTEQWIKQRDQLINSGGSAKDINDLTKKINKAEKSMVTLEKQAHNVIETIDNMDASSLEQLRQAERMLNAEMQKTPQNTQYFQDLTEKLQQVKTAIAGIREQTKSTFTEQEQLNAAMQNMQSVLENLNTSSLSQLAQAEKTLKEQMANAVPNNADYDNAAANLKLVQNRINQINEAQKTVNRTIDKYEEEIKRSNELQKDMSREWTLINNTLKNLDKSSVRDIEYSIKLLNEELRGVEQGSDEFKQINDDLTKMKTKLQAINNESRETQSIWGRVSGFLNKNWGAFTQIIAGVSGLTFTMRKAVQAFADMEEAMADTRKYTGLTDNEVRELNNQFKEMDTRTAREELNELAGAAGRLGITAQNDIIDFVEAGNMIKVALGDDLGEGAIDDIGKLAMAFGEDDTLGLRGAMLATGSAVNELAQNSAAKAGYLVNFTARVGAFGKTLGLTQSQIMGFGAALDENLLQEEMAATAFGNMLTKMRSDTAKFAKIAGKDVEEFTRLLNEDANGAVLALADSLKKQDGKTMIKMLDDMGLDGSRAVAVLSVLADKIDDVRKHQETATQGYEQATSVVDEYNTMNNTTQAQLDKAKKAFQEITIELGQKLQPIAEKAITTGSLAMKGLSALMNIVTSSIGTITSLAVAIAALTVIRKADIIQTKLQNFWNVTLMGNMKKLRAVIAANPWATVALAAAALVGVLIDLTRRSNEATVAQKAMADIEHQANVEMAKQKNEIERLKEKIHDNNLSLKERESAIADLKKIVPEYTAQISTEGDVYRENTRALDKYIKKLKEEALVKGAQKKLEELGEQRAELEAQRIELEEQIRQRREEERQRQQSRQGKPQTSQGGTAPASVYENMGASAEISAMERQQTRLERSITQTDQAIARVAKIGGEVKKTITPDGGGDGGNGDYESEADQKKREAEENKRRAAERATEAARRREEAQRNKDYKEELKQAKAHATALQQENYLRFTQETHDLEKFRKEELRIQTESLDEQIEIAKRYHGEDASEVATLQQKKLELLKGYNEETVSLREEDIKHAETIAKMQAEREFHTKGSELYNNEAAYQQRISEIELNALSERLEIMKQKNMEGTAEYIRLQNEYNERKGQAQLDSEIYYQEQLERYREEWGRLGNEKQLQLAMQGLDELHRKGLLKEEEYQRMKREIQATYAQNPVEQGNENFNKNVSSAVTLAKSKASGGVDETQGASLTNNPFVGTITLYASTMSNLKQMYANDEMTYEEYQAAKRKVTGDFLNDMVTNFQAAYNTINGVMSAASSYYAAQSQYEQNVTTKKYDKMIEKAGSNQKKQKKLEEKKQKELAKIKNKYNKKQAKIQIAQAIAQTAISAINAYSSAAAIPVVGHILAPVAAAMAVAAGMLQVATIKKQAAAQEEGYYSGGFTGGNRYRRVAGQVHEGEFVVNHDGVNNPNLMPVLRLLDRAQQNNTIGSLTAGDVSQQLGHGGAVVAPIVNVQNDNEELRGTIGAMNESIDRLNYNLENPTERPISVEELDRKLDIFKKYKNNK